MHDFLMVFVGPDTNRDRSNRCGFFVIGQVGRRRQTGGPDQFFVDPGRRRLAKIHHHVLDQWWCFLFVFERTLTTLLLVLWFQKKTRPIAIKGFADGILFQTHVLTMFSERVKFLFDFFFFFVIIIF